MIRRLSPRHTLITLPLALTLLAACGSDETFDPLKPTRIETTVSTHDVEVGTAVEVTCVMYNAKDGAIVGRPFDVHVTPDVRVIINGMSVSPTRSGTHAVACGAADIELIDDTPELVNARPGPAVRTSLTLTPSTIEAGGASEVSCLAQDSFGNTTPADVRLNTDPATGLNVSGVASVSGTTAGSWDLTCFYPNLGPADLGKATLTVVPGPRTGIILTLSPERVSYGLSAPVRVGAEAVDAYGNLRGETISVQNINAAPTGSHRVSGTALDLLSFTLEGKYVVSAEAADIPSQTATIDLVVDETAPVLTLESPDRAIVTDVLETLRFKGTVTDNLGEVASLMVGATEIRVGSGGAFDAEVPLTYGLNLFDVVAVDPYGNEMMTTRGAEKSTKFYPLTARDMATDGVQNALTVVMTQDAIDDGVQGDGKRDDLASIVQFVLENIDFASFVSNPLVSFNCIGGQCTLDLTSVKFGSVDVDMPLRNGRVGFQATLHNFEGTITLWFPCAIGIFCPTNPRAFPGTLKIDKIVMTSDIALSIVGGEIRTRAENTDVTVGTITVDITGDPTGITSAAVNILLVIIGPYITTVMDAVMVAVIEDQVASAFGGLFSALAIDTNFELPSIVPNGAPNVIQLRTSPRGIDIAPERLQVRMDALATAETPARPHASLGSINHNGCAPMTSMTLPPPGRITVGLHDDFINQLLFAIWEGGTVNIALSPPESDALLGSFGFNGATLNVSALLPPVFNSCQARNGSGEIIPDIVDRAQLAELFVEILLPDGAGGSDRIALWLLAEAPINIEFGPNAEGAQAARLVVAGIEPLFVEIVANEGLFEGDDEAVRALVGDVLVPQLLGIIEEAATFALPAIDLGALTTAVPAGTTLNLNIGGVGRDNAYMTVFGTLE